MRRKHDFYPTELRLTKGLMKLVGSFIEGQIIEPCNGMGHISQILKENNKNVITSDIMKGSDWQGDATNELIWKQFPIIDWTITNPPFNEALSILKNALKYSQKGVITLARLSFLEPTYDRTPFWKQYPPNKLIINPRISFTQDGKSDSVTTCWICWGKFDSKHFDIIEK